MKISIKDINGGIHSVIENDIDNIQSHIGISEGCYSIISLTNGDEFLTSESKSKIISKLNRIRRLSKKAPK